MNRKVATSEGSGIDDTHREAENVSGEVGLRSDAIENPQAATPSRARKPSASKGDSGFDAGRAPGNVGQLLRGAYRQTVDEAIPDDLMDLLNKLE